MTTAKRWSIIGMVALYGLLLAILAGVWLPHFQEPEATPTPEAKVASGVWFYGLCRQEGTGAILRGAAVTIWQGGAQRGRSVAVSGSWGMFINPSLGTCTLRVEEPLGWFVTGMVPPVVTGWRYDGGPSATFDPPPSSPASDLVIYFSPLVTPTPYNPTPTFTSQPVTPSPTWTPGPTPTPIAEWLQIEPPVVNAILAEWGRILPLYGPLWDVGTRYGLGLPVTQVITLTVDGVQYQVQAWQPISAIIRRVEDGRTGIADGGSIAP